MVSLVPVQFWSTFEPLQLKTKKKHDKLLFRFGKKENDLYCPDDLMWHKTCNMHRSLYNVPYIASDSTNWRVQIW